MRGMRARKTGIRRRDSGDQPIQRGAGPPLSSYNVIDIPLA